MTVRLFLGGLPPGVTCEELQARFQAFGKVEACHIVPPKTYEALPGDEGFHRGVGFVTLDPIDEAALRKCMGAYNGSRWRGHVLKCQLAKEDYKQRLQGEAQEAQQPSRQELARRRGLTPLEPGTKLRVRHPSKPITVEVQLCSGQRVTSFPPEGPATGSSSSLGAAASWEALPPPPRARYTYEARLRAAGEQAAARRAAGAGVEAEGRHAEERLGGAAIPPHYSLTASHGSDSDDSFAAKSPRATGGQRQRQQQQQQSGRSKGKHQQAGIKTAGPSLDETGQQQQQQQQQQPPKRQRVVDFLDAEEGWGQPLTAQLDLSRFGSDSEGEGEGHVLAAAVPAAQRKAAGPAVRGAAQKLPPLPKQAQHVRKAAGQQLAGPAAKEKPAGGKVQQQQQQQQQWPQQQEQRWAAQALPQASKRKARVVEFDEGGASGEEQGPAELASELARFGSSDSEGEEEERALGSSPIVGSAVPAGTSPSQQQRSGRSRLAPRQLQQQHSQVQQELQQARVAVEQRTQQPGAQQAQAQAQQPTSEAKAPDPEQATVPEPRGEHSKPRAVVEFLSPEDEEQLRRRKRPAVDLSRFGSDSEDSGGGPPGAWGGAPVPQLDGAWDLEEKSGSEAFGGGPRGAWGGVPIPQLDGAWDSEGESDSGSESGSESGGNKASSGGSEGGSGEEASEGGGGASGRGGDNSSQGDSADSDSSGSDGSEGSEGGGSVSGSEEEEDGEEGEGEGGAAATAATRPSDGAATGRAPVLKGGAAQQGEAQGASDGWGGAAEPPPAWMSRLLPAGAAFLRQEPLERIEAAWRAGREGWAQDYRSKHRQAVRHLSRPASKKQRRK